jgi:1-acyl-sn-glycerol-3-phosphate acyltransferase
LKKFNKKLCKFGFYICGFTVDRYKSNISYKEYLGPDWIPEWDEPCTVVGNHHTYFDNFVLIEWCMVSFVGKDTFKKIPFVTMIYQLLNIITLKRVGKDAEASRQKAIELIKERQSQMASGECFNSLVIFPEGCTTNG